MKNSSCCLLIEDTFTNTDVVHLLHENNYEVIRRNIYVVNNVINTKQVICTVFNINNNLLTNHIDKYIRSYKNIPLVVILYEKNMELARYCGELGVNRVICSNEIRELPKIINEISIKKNTKITLKSFGLNINDYKGSKIVFESLLIIEQKYTYLMSVQELAQELNVSDNSISREFHKEKLISPKKLMLYFKVIHALYLMENKGLRLNEIANLSGFTNERRFNECFHRIFEESPGLIRNAIFEIGVDAVWKNHINRRLKKRSV